MTIAEMRRRYAHGYTLEQIGQHAGCSRNKVARLLRTAGVEIRPQGGSVNSGRTPISPAERSLMVERYFVDGWSMARIGEHFNRSAQAVWLVLNRVGFKTRDRGRSPAFQEGR